MTTKPIASAYPLAWPDGWKRTPSYQRTRSRYKVSSAAATEHLFDELRRMGAARSSIVLSTNLVLRNDGLPYANQPRHSVDDPGVAVYWSTRSFKERVIACDKWAYVYDNIHALGLTIAALRSIDRAGATQVLEQAFTAFGALPAAAAAPVTRPWWEVFGLPQEAVKLLDLTMCEARYRESARKAHPDAGGSTEAMAELNRAREEMRRHYGQ